MLCFGSLILQLSVRPSGTRCRGNTGWGAQSASHCRAFGHRALGQVGSETILVLSPVGVSAAHTKACHRLFALCSDLSSGSPALWMHIHMAHANVQKPPKTILFACVHNAGRSQMACAWLKALADPQVVRSISAGTAPGERVHPEVRDVMRENGIDLSRIQPQQLTSELAKDAHLMITMGCGALCPYCGTFPEALVANFPSESRGFVTLRTCLLPPGEACPHIPGLRRMDWPLEDPKVSTPLGSDAGSHLYRPPEAVSLSCAREFARQKLPMHRQASCAANLAGNLSMNSRWCRESL